MARKWEGAQNSPHQWGVGQVVLRSHTASEDPAKLHYGRQDSRISVVAGVMPPVELGWCRRWSWDDAAGGAGMMPPVELAWCRRWSWHDAAGGAGMVPPVELAWCRRWSWHDAAGGAGMVPPVELRWCRRWSWDDAAGGAGMMPPVELAWCRRWSWHDVAGLRCAVGFRPAPTGRDSRITAASGTWQGWDWESQIGWSFWFFVNF